MPSPSLEFLKSHEIVRAGAGAGKTYALTHKVADLAADFQAKNGRMPRVIVTTFTRKATGELRERLMVLALDEKPALIDFVNSRSHLVVSTIHGVMDLYLKRYGANLCVDPGYKIIGASEASKIARQVLRQIVLGNQEFSHLLESYQFNRIVSLVRKLDSLRYENPGVKPFALGDFEALFQIRGADLAKRLQEAAARIREETDKEAWVQHAELFEGLGALLTRGKWNVNRPFFISAKSDLKQPRKPNKADHPVSETTLEFLKEVRKSINEFVEPVYDPAAWDIFASNFEIFEKIAGEFHDQFHKAKLTEGLLEISDLEHLAMACIRKHPETAEAFWREWDYWLIDEYQDTSPFQVELLRHLTGESPNFVVGDPQQSIYLFRGARSEVFGARQAQIAQGGGSQRLLKMNRRSAPELLLFMNDFFKRLDPPFEEMEPFFRAGQSLEPKKVVATIYIGTPTSERLEEAAAGDADGDPEEGATEKIDEPSEDDPKNEQELRAIVFHIQKLIAAGAKPEEICVLARTNKVLVDVANRLSDAHLPTHVHAASGFYDRRETRDALALLKFLVNPHDNFNTIEVLRSPWFKTPDKTLVKFTRRVESVWQTLTQNFEASDDFRSILRLQNLLQESRSFGLSEAFKRGLIEAGFIDLSHFHDVSGRRESNIWKLLSRLQQDECQPGFNPLAFISSSRVDIKMDEGNSEGDAVAAVEPNRINLMTVHASKGLEFDHVIVPRMEQKPQLTTHEEFTFDERNDRWAMRVPFGENHEMTKSLAELNWLEGFKRSELEEHARVLYVAITRAVETVFLSWTGQPQKQSWAEMIRLDLAVGLHEGPSYSYRVEVGDGEALAIETAPETPLKPRALFHANAKDGEKALSVTDILDRQAGMQFKTGSDKQVTQLLQAASVGSAVHRLMESLKYHAAASGLEPVVRKWFPGQEEKVFRAIDFVRTNPVPPLLEIIANGEVEWGFAIMHEGLLIEGQIDLWGRSDEGELWIVDYKTGHPDGRTKAFEQMAIYAFALRKSGLLKLNERIQLAAIYPFAREVYVDEDPGEARVLELLRPRSSS